MNDPIADFLTRIRNAQRAGHRRVDVPASKLKRAMAKILVDKGYISSSSISKTESKGSSECF